LKAPRIRASRVGIVALEEADTLATVDGKCNVLAHQPDALATMDRALGLGLSHLPAVAR
jgi:hypothetical protein